MYKILRPSTLSLLLVTAHLAHAAAADANFYRGKTIRFIVGFAAGAGFDVYSRVIARHMSRHSRPSADVLVPKN